MRSRVFLPTVKMFPSVLLKYFHLPSVFGNQMYNIVQVTSTLTYDLTTNKITMAACKFHTVTHSKQWTVLSIRYSNPHCGCYHLVLVLWGFLSRIEYMILSDHFKLCTYSNHQ